MKKSKQTCRYLLKQESLFSKLFTLLLLLLCLQGSAQDAARITGRITDSSGNGVSGASVTVKGGRTGVATDSAGNFTITAASNATLIVSALGYAQSQIAVNGRSQVSTTLFPAVTQSLDQVVVVGYGTQRRRDLTGAVASVSGAEIAKQPVQTATQAIQGKIAGVQVIGSGEPNSLPSVRIRGTGSTLGGVNPLYVVDGVLTDDIRNINSADIVTMDVLKDASSTAIYGMRAANGVIIITTKRGRSGKPVFSYDANVSVREATNLVNMAGENQYAGYLNEANLYYGSGSVLIPQTSLTGANTDWYDVILRKAQQQSHNLSLSGGGDKFTYFLSAGYFTDEGILKNNKFKRLTVRSNNDYTISKVFKVSSMISYTNGNADNPVFDAFSNAYRAAPFIPSKVGDLYGNTSANGNVGNPLLSIDKTYNNTSGNRVQGNFALEVRPIAGLTLRSAINLDLTFFRSRSYGYFYDGSVFLTPGGNQTSVNRTLTTSNDNASRWIWDNTATYIKTFGRHSINLLAGITSEEYNYTSLGGSVFGVPENRDQWYLNAGTNGTQSVQNTGDKYARNSYLGRINYTYNNRYLLTATLRADGTSRFSSNNRWDNFPSVALGWNIAEEGFMQNQRLFDNLKIRGSWGKVGNDNIASSLYYSLAQQNVPYYFNGQLTQAFLGIRFPDITDRNLKWEITNEYDLGLDFTILGKRLTGTIDYYDKKTDNALIYIPLPGILGDPDNQYLTNATSISNKGVEFGVNWSDRIGKDWNYAVSGNIAFNKNNIEKLNGGQPLLGDLVANYAITRTDNGQPIGSYYLRRAIGVFQTEAQIAASAQKDARPGDLMYEDVSGPAGKPDGIINDLDRVYAGSYQPKVTYGISSNVSFRNFDLSIITYGTAGGKIYNAKKASRGSIQQTDNIEADVAINRWTPNNPNTGNPRATLGQLPASTYFLESGDFFRLNNLTLGYTFSKSMLRSAKVSNLRVYVTSQNLLTITPYHGFTPEIRTPEGNRSTLNQGVDTNTYPSTRTFAFGVNLGF